MFIQGVGTTDSGGGGSFAISDDGEVVIQTTDSEEFRLLGSASYPQGLRVRTTGTGETGIISYCAKTGIFTVSFAIADAQGNILKKTCFDVKSCPQGAERGVLPVHRHRAPGKDPRRTFAHPQRQMGGTQPRRPRREGEKRQHIRPEQRKKDQKLHAAEGEREGAVRASLLIDTFPLWCVELPLMCLLGLVLKVPNEVFCLCIAIEHLAKTLAAAAQHTHDHRGRKAVEGHHARVAVHHDRAHRCRARREGEKRQHKAVCLTAFLFALALGGVELLVFFTLLRP